MENPNDEPNRPLDYGRSASQRAEPGNGELGSTLDHEFVSQVTSLVSEEPRTVREVHELVAQDAGLSRDQTEYRLGKLSASGAIQSKKSPGRTGTQIFWSTTASNSTESSNLDWSPREDREDE